MDLGDTLLLTGAFAAAYYWIDMLTAISWNHRKASGMDTAALEEYVGSRKLYEWILMPFRTMEYMKVLNQRDIGRSEMYKLHSNPVKSIFD